MNPINSIRSKEEPGLTPTLNKMGYMFDNLTKVGEAFVAFAAKSPKPVLDLGAAYGVATLAALERGATVMANDLDKRHLEILKNITPESLRPKLTTVPGHFPEGLHFDDNAFGAILMSNVLHFLMKEEIIEGVQQVYRWLDHRGKIFVLAGTPFVKMAETFLPIYEQRVAEGHPWPAFVEDSGKYLGERANALPSFMHYFDLPSLTRVFKNAGFTIEWADYLSRFDWPEDMQLDGREQVGLIGIKE